MNIKKVNKKIKSVSNVKKITKAMELVSAIKMKKAQQAAIEARPYREGLNKIINKITQSVKPESAALLSADVAQTDRQLAILISTNKGLCGSININLFRFLLSDCDIAKTDFITIGKKGAFFLSRIKGSVILADFSMAKPVSEVSAVFELIIKNYLAGKYNQAYLVYNKFINTLKSQPTKEILLPLTLKLEEKSDKIAYLIEPVNKQFLDSLLASYLEQKIRGAVVESEAVEHSARMVAMKNATDNAEDVIYNLTLLSNRLRQEKITYELLDMTTAKESVASE